MMMASGLLRRLPDTPPLKHLVVDARTLVLHFRHHPTVHYYWRSRYPVSVIIDTSITGAYAINLTNFDQIVIVRHIASDWLSYLDRTKPAHMRVIYFLDDDIPGLLPDGYLTARYVLKNRYRYLRSLRNLDRLCTAVCVSTPAFAERYALPLESVVEPLPCESDLPSTNRLPSNGATPMIFYHGTGTHKREVAWLTPVIESVLRQVPHARFELIGDRRIERTFSDFENVRVLRQMSWTDYLRHCRSQSFDIGLAPLLPTRFNLVRSHVKFFDITRCGAPGIYSNRPPFEGTVQSEQNGLLVNDSRDAWVDAIVALATNKDLRERLLERALVDVRQRIGAGRQNDR